jgi:hypothetical protein
MGGDPDIERVREALRRHDRDSEPAPDGGRDEREERAREELREHDEHQGEDDDDE